MTIIELVKEFIFKRKNKYCLVNVNSESGVAYSVENPVRQWLKLDKQSKVSIDDLLLLEKSIFDEIESEYFKSQMVSLKELISQNGRPFDCRFGLNVDGIEVIATYMIVTNGKGGAEMRISLSVE